MHRVFRVAMPTLTSTERPGAFGLCARTHILCFPALLLGALVTILSGTETTFDFRWAWINYSLTLTRIYGLDDEMEYLSASEAGASAEQLDSIFEGLQTALAEINDSWASRRLRDVAQPSEPTKTPTER
jgi:hypothetical protein